MLSKKRNRSKKKDANTENTPKKNENKNESDILEKPLKQQNENNNKTKKDNKENEKKRNVRGRTKKEINNNSMHNKEVKNNNSENIDDYQNMGSQINNNNIKETNKNDNHTSIINNQNNKEENNIDNKIQNQTSKSKIRIYVTPNPEDFETDNKNNTQTYKNDVQNNANDKINSRKRAKSFIKINKNISIIPKNCNIFKKFDLFNSLLLIINNISLIKNYFSKHEVINLIKKCEKNNKNCLSSISYYINKYLWYKKNKKIKSQKKLLKEYIDFVKIYSKENCKNNDPDLYCLNIDNLEYIINFIYNRINVELTNSNEDKKVFKPTNNDLLSKYLVEFSKKNNSIISDHFIGHYQNKKLCMKCNNAQFSYELFRTISFSVKITYNYFYNNNNYFQFNCNMLNYNNINNNNISNNGKYIKIKDCFNYLFMNYYNKYNSYCENCNGNTDKKESYSIFSLPNIITIVLNDNNDNDYFILEDKIDLKNYVIKVSGNEIYNLISILCKISYNGKFINYCFNPNNVKWYSYIDGKISEVDEMDINAIPLMLVYQTNSENDFTNSENDIKYKSIKRETDKIKFNINFSNESTATTIYFNKNESFKDLYENISSYFNLSDKKFALLINGNQITEGHNLNEFINNKNNGMLVLFN